MTCRDASSGSWNPASSARLPTLTGEVPLTNCRPKPISWAVTHYLEALDFQKEIVKIHTIFGGRNPHPNWLVGGMPCSINIDETGATGAVNMAWLNQVSDIINNSIAFVDQVYIPDLTAIASFYKDWGYGGGLSSKNVMAYGEFPAIPNNYTNEKLDVAERRDS